MNKEVRQREGSESSSESGHRKRNSVCLQPSGSQSSSGFAQLQQGGLSRYPTGSFRKTRRFTVENASALLGGPLYDVSSEHQADPISTETVNRESTNRRSSLYTPKPAWPGQELWDNPVEGRVNSAFNPLGYGNQYDSHINPAFPLSFDIPRLHNMKKQSFSGESKYDGYYFYDSRYSGYINDHDSSSTSGMDPMKKGAWTKEEDDLLIKFGGMASNKNWTEIAEKIPGRSAKQCRERWCFNLDPSINKELWTGEEDIMLIRKQLEVGNKWAQIAMLLPGRTENAVKTRFKSILRARKREWKPSEDQLLLQLHQSMGANWEGISSRMASHRTKHAVKMRFKELLAGLDTLKFPEFGSARQTVREAYYPRATLKEVSSHYRLLANGKDIPNPSNPVVLLEPNAATSQISMQLPRINSQHSFLRYDPRNTFPSFYMPPGIKHEQGNASFLSQTNDPFDEFFNLCSEDDPLILA